MGKKLNCFLLLVSAFEAQPAGQGAYGVSLTLKELGTAAWLLLHFNFSPKPSNIKP